MENVIYYTYYILRLIAPLFIYYYLQWLTNPINQTFVYVAAIQM